MICAKSCREPNERGRDVMIRVGIGTLMEREPKKYAALVAGN